MFAGHVLEQVWVFEFMLVDESGCLIAELWGKDAVSMTGLNDKDITWLNVSSFYRGRHDNQGNLTTGAIVLFILASLGSQ